MLSQSGPLPGPGSPMSGSRSGFTGPLNPRAPRPKPPRWKSSGLQPCKPSGPAPTQQHKQQKVTIRYQYHLSGREKVLNTPVHDPTAAPQLSCCIGYYLYVHINNRTCLQPLAEVSGSRAFAACSPGMLVLITLVTLTNRIPSHSWCHLLIGSHLTPGAGPLPPMPPALPGMMSGCLSRSAKKGWLGPTCIPPPVGPNPGEPGMRQTRQSNMLAQQSETRQAHAWTAPITASSWQ
jgi:hypothetical protein